MSRRDEGEREIVYVEREGGSLRPLLLGMALGAGLALLFAPDNGEQTRRKLRRQLRKWRALTEETVGELSERFGSGGRPGGPPLPPDEDEEAPEREPTRAVGGHRGAGGRAAAEPAARPVSSAREELERRLADARARRRGAPAVADDEEPLA